MIQKILATLLIILSLGGCGKDIKDNKEKVYTTFEEVMEDGKNKEVSIFMWGGNDGINKYMDNFVKKRLKEKYNITLKRVPMNASDFVAKILNEKKNNTKESTIDVIWVNAENFKVLKEAKGLYGPFTNVLINQNTLYNPNLNELHYDSGIPIEGYEAMWGAAQLVYSYDNEIIKSPPKTYKEILEFSRKYPGKFTYPNPLSDFVGSAFVRNAYFELTDMDFSKEISKEEFLEISKPVIEYFKQLNPYLWNKGESFPQTVALQDNLFKNNEVYITIGFEVYKTAGKILKKEYKPSVKTFVLDSGTIGNSHYLGIPYNAKEKAGGILVIDYLQGAEAQIEKMKPEVWGDMSGIDVEKLSENEKEKIKKIEEVPGVLTSKELLSKRRADMNSTYIQWVEEIWEEQIIN